MSQDERASGPRYVDIHGQVGERQVALAGWIGEHPIDGADVAHLLIHPLGHGVADKMRVLAGVLGLAADAPPQVPPDTTWIGLDEPPGWARIHHGQDAWIGRPATPEWLTIARARHLVVLSLGLDGGSVRRERDIDRYVGTQARRGRLYLGLVRATEA